MEVLLGKIGDLMRNHDKIFQFDSYGSVGFPIFFMRKYMRF